LRFTNDDEWKIISDRIEKVMTAQPRPRIGGFGFGGPGGRRGSDTAKQTQATTAADAIAVECSAASQTPMPKLSKALDSKASADD